MFEEQLIYVASNSKGISLYKELKKFYQNSCYIDAGFRSIPKALLILSRLINLSISFEKSRKENVEYYLWLRNKIAKNVMIKVPQLCRNGRKNHILLWFPLFPVPKEWKTYGEISSITDVAIDEVYFENFNIPHGKAREFRKEMCTINFENCDHIFTLSEWAREANQKLYPNPQKVKRIGWGPNTKTLSIKDLHATQRKNRILSIGHDYYRKGMDVYNEVSQKLKERIPNLECIVIGRSGKALGYSAMNSLTIYPSASLEQVAFMMKTSKLFMLFSRFEPAGHVIVEAMSHGLPVICSDRYGVVEPILEGETGYSCNINDLGDIVDKAYTLLTDNTKFEQFSRGAYEHAMREWQWQHVAGRILSAWRV